MALPTPDEYNDAIQTPRHAFPDPDLASGTVECNGFGIPRPCGGGFAITYRVTNGERSFAVRCFHKEVHDLQSRYRIIHNCLKAARLAPFVEFEYQPIGIRVRGTTFPIVKMEWVSGMTLGEYVERNHDNRQAMERLRSQFATLEQELASKGVAHGDLQNANVLVENAQLRLVDYDGMFVNGMPLGNGGELGLKTFQHPLRRPTDFGPDIDRFSFIVIDLSLWALSLRADLFKRFSTGENILFSANDFADPDSSTVFQMLRQVGDSAFQQSLSDFICVCKADVKSVPRLTDFLSRRAIPKVTIHEHSPPGITKYIGALPVVDASSFESVCLHVGDRVELVGQVVEIKTGVTREGKLYVCVHFRRLRENCVRATFFSDGVKALGCTPDNTWVGQWLVINGLINPGSAKYSDGWITIGPTVSDSSQLRKIPKEEALWRLAKGPRPSGVAKTDGMPVQKRNAEIVAGLGANAKPPARKWPIPTNPKTAATSKPTNFGTTVLPTTPAGQSTVKTRNEEVLQNIRTSTPSSPIGASPVGTPKQKPKATGCAICAAMIVGAFVAFVGLVALTSRMVSVP